jgi:predicted ATPase/class 3 adenylate cyclase
MPDTLTFAFTDIVDSTATNLALGDKAYQAIADRHDALIRSIAAPAELKTIGDSFMLRFDDPAEAVGKLVQVQRRLAESPIMLGDKSLAVRMGIHIGNPLPAPGALGQEDYRGSTLNQAARYESLARGGQILISEQVYRLVKDRTHELPGISYCDWGPYFLKGVGWQRVFEVLWDNKKPAAPSGRPQHASRRFLVPFIGRERELNEVQLYLKDENPRLVTLKGPGGIGKTRLADEIERRASQLFGDGTFFVELESTPDNPKDIEDQIRAKCGIDAGATDNFFVNKSALLILNNVESVPSVGFLVHQLLKRCGALRILATSQVPLQVPGEQLWPVDSLEPDDAEKMFREYARRHDPSFEITAANRAHLRELFRLTDRIPFCLELAAAKIRPGRSLQNIVAGIGKNLASLGAEEMESPRHKSVSACLDWSFGLLGGEEKDLFPKLSVFQDGFLPADVAVVCGVTNAEGLLFSLYDSSLLRLVDDRFFLLPTAGEYAGAKLGAARPELLRRHAEHYLAVLERADRKTRTREHRAGFTVIRKEFENLRAGMLWAAGVEQDELIVRYGQAFANNLATVRRAAAEVEFSEIALQAARRMADRLIEASAQNNLGGAYQNLPTGERGENLRKAIQCYEAALQVYTERDFPVHWAMIQNNLGSAYWNLPTGDRGENLRKAIECYKAALRVRTEQDFPVDWATTQNNLGIAFLDLPTGDRDENLRRAIDCYEAPLRVYTEKEFPLQWAMTQNNLGIVYRNRPTTGGENLRKAISCYEAALRVYTEQDFPMDWAMTQNNLGNAFLGLPTGDRGENLRKAIDCYEAALRVFTEKDFPVDWAMTQNNLGIVYRNVPTGDRGENLRKAINCYEAALRVYTEKDFPMQWAGAQNNLGLAYRDLPPGDAHENARRALAYFENSERGYRAAHLENEASEVALRITELREGAT